MSAVSPDLLQRFDVPGPRYTSYPTADRFVEAFGADDYIQALEQRRTGMAKAMAMPLSLYVHIPFCESLCYYCACNKIITKHHRPREEYLRYLSREIDLHTAHVGGGRSFPSCIWAAERPPSSIGRGVAELMAMLRRSFTFAPGGEYSIEIDPRTVDATAGQSG
jgi:oxygen-independent coproporphyrinogen-3 oxidase